MTVRFMTVVFLLLIGIGYVFSILRVRKINENYPERIMTSFIKARSLKVTDRIHQPLDNTNNIFFIDNKGFYNIIVSDLNHPVRQDITDQQRARTHHFVDEQTNVKKQKSRLLGEKAMTSMTSKRMFALIFWVKCKKTSVKRMDEIGRDCRKGDELRLPDEGRSYKARILEVSEDKHWLERLEVTVDGEVMPPQKKTQKTRGLAGQKSKAVKIAEEKILRLRIDGIGSTNTRQGTGVIGTKEPDGDEVPPIQKPKKNESESDGVVLPRQKQQKKENASDDVVLPRHKRKTKTVNGSENDEVISRKKSKSKDLGESDDDEVMPRKKLKSKELGESDDDEVMPRKKSKSKELGESDDDEVMPRKKSKTKELGEFDDDEVMPRKKSKSKELGESDDDEVMPRKKSKTKKVDGSENDDAMLRKKAKTKKVEEADDNTVMTPRKNVKTSKLEESDDNDEMVLRGKGRKSRKRSLTADDGNDEIMPIDKKRKNRERRLPSDDDEMMPTGVGRKSRKSWLTSDDDDDNDEMMPRDVGRKSRKCSLTSDHENDEIMSRDKGRNSRKWPLTSDDDDDNDEMMLRGKRRKSRKRSLTADDGNDEIMPIDKERKNRDRRLPSDDDEMMPTGVERKSRKCWLTSDDDEDNDEMMPRDKGRKSRKWPLTSDDDDDNDEMMPRDERRRSQNMSVMSDNQNDVMMGREQGRKNQNLSLTSGDDSDAIMSKDTASQQTTCQNSKERRKLLLSSDHDGMMPRNKGSKNNTTEFKKSAESAEAIQSVATRGESEWNIGVPYKNVNDQHFPLTSDDDEPMQTNEASKQPNRQESNKNHRVSLKPDDDAEDGLKAKITAAAIESLGPLVAEMVAKLLEEKTSSLSATSTSKMTPLPSTSRTNILSRPSTSRSMLHSRPLSPHSYDENEASNGSSRPRPGEVEIQPNSGVYVDHTELTLLNRWKHQPSTIVRKLLLYLVGAKKLKEMSARGKSVRGKPKRLPVPPAILKAIKYYIDRKGIYKMLEPDYIHLINQQCNTLRHPHISGQKEKTEKEDEIPEDKRKDNSDTE